MNEIQKDPVCGMTVLPANSLTAFYQGQAYYFCSEFCQRKFAADPGKYATGLIPSAPSSADSRRIAYFSMEVGVDSHMPTYSGGLGVLAGDTLKSFADLAIGFGLIARQRITAPS